MCRAPSYGGLAVMAMLSWSAVATPVRAQAWVPDVGDASVAWSVQYSRVMKHLLSVSVDAAVDASSGYRLGPENQAHFGDISSFLSTLAGEYVPLRNLAVTGEVVLVSSRYAGLAPAGEFDDGQSHGDLQDMTLGTRYMVRRGGFVLGPAVNVRFPLTDYHSVGHSYAGSGLVSATLALNSGYSLSPWLPGTYILANYSRVLVEDLAGFSLDRNELTGGLGRFFNHSLSVQAQFQYVETQDGVDWYWASPLEPSNHEHVTAKATARRVGASVGYSLSHRLGSALSWESTVSGANTHAVHSLTLGMSYGFSKRPPN